MQPRTTDRRPSRVRAAAWLTGAGLRPTRQRLALAELLACFPVYRSYLPAGRQHLDAAAGEAEVRRPELGDVIEKLVPVLADTSLEVAWRFQQTTGPVMAKGVEDTAFYRYTRLGSLTEVGGEFPAWSNDGNVVHFALGNAYFRYDLQEAQALDDSTVARQRATVGRALQARATVDSLKKVRASIDSLTRANRVVPDSLRARITALVADSVRQKADSIIAAADELRARAARSHAYGTRAARRSCSASIPTRARSYASPRSCSSCTTR